MSKAVITESSLSDIGDAIREQLGVSTEYLPSQMGAAVRSISGGGTTDYSELSNKPQINSVELSGNKSSSDLGLQDALTFDASPTSGSTHPVTSGGVYTALSSKVNTSAVGSASGVAELDENGHVPSSQLPSYVDDVVEGYYNESTDKFYEDSSYTTEIAGEAGKIYITLDTNLSYRWSGTGFVVISPSLALGETSSTAYRGDRGATAYSTSQTNASAISGINTALGSTDISSVGDGTVTGAISTLNNSIETSYEYLAENSLILYRFGKLRILTNNGLFTTVPYSFGAIIPAGDRPQVITYATASSQGNASAYMVRVYTDGKMDALLNGSSATISNAAFNMSWVVA